MILIMNEWNNDRKSSLVIDFNLQDLVEFTAHRNSKKNFYFFLSNLDELRTLIYINAQSSTDNVDR